MELGALLDLPPYLQHSKPFLLTNTILRKAHVEVEVMAQIRTRIFLLMSVLISGVLFHWAAVNVGAQGLRGWRTDTSKSSIDLNELMSGGIGKDGIPAILNPQFVSISAAQSWIKPQEPVIALVSGEEARAYPLQILMWHEIVNDRISDVPVIITFCPLCNSAMAFDARVEGRELTFGVTGLLRYSDMIMYDRETETLWQQLIGEAVVGDFVGKKLKQVPVQIISFAQFIAAYENGKVLSRETGFQRDYGRNPYAGYDNVLQRPFLFRGKIDERLAPMERVIAVTIGKTSKAYPYTESSKQRVIHDEIGKQPIVVFHAPGAVSALDQADISSSRTIGSTGVYDPILDGKKLTFQYSGGVFIDEQTNSEWDITGRAIAGKLQGKRLRLIPHSNEFAFAWLVFKPKTIIWGK